MRDADQGTAARPGRRLPLISSADASANLAQLIEGLEISAKVRPSLKCVGPACSITFGTLSQLYLALKGRGFAGFMRLITGTLARALLSQFETRLAERSLRNI